MPLRRMSRNVPAVLLRCGQERWLSGEEFGISTKCKLVSPASREHHHCGVVSTFTQQNGQNCRSQCELSIGYNLLDQIMSDCTSTAQWPSDLHWAKWMPQNESMSRCNSLLPYRAQDCSTQCCVVYFSAAVLYNRRELVCMSPPCQTKYLHKQFVCANT